MVNLKKTVSISLIVLGGVLTTFGIISFKKIKKKGKLSNKMDNYGDDNLFI